MASIPWPVGSSAPTDERPTITPITQSRSSTLIGVTPSTRAGQTAQPTVPGEREDLLLCLRLPSMSHLTWEDCGPHRGLAEERTVVPIPDGPRYGRYRPRSVDQRWLGRITARDGPSLVPTATTSRHQQESRQQGPRARPRSHGCRVEGRPDDGTSDGTSESGRLRSGGRRRAGRVLAQVKCLPAATWSVGQQRWADATAATSASQARERPEDRVAPATSPKVVTLTSTYQPREKPRR